MELGCGAMVDPPTVVDHATQKPASRFITKSYTRVCGSFNGFAYWWRICICGSIIRGWVSIDCARAATKWSCTDARRSSGSRHQFARSL